MFNAYAKRKGVDVSPLRFLLDGNRIHPDQTPGDLELEDQDQIDCMELRHFYSNYYNYT